MEKANIARDYIYINRGLNRSYFNCIDSYDKAYFLGLLITDGSIVNNAVTISLKKNDSYILDTLNKKIGNENPLYFDNRGMATLHFKSKDVVDSLSKYGVVPRKTFTSFLPIFNDFQLMSSLIRGLIDGDGWISFKSHSIGFCSASFTLISQLHSYLIQMLDVYNVSIINCRENLYMINWSSKNDILKIGSYIYIVIV